MSERIRYQLSASVFVLLLRDGKVCMIRRKATGWMDGSLSIPAGGLDFGETIAAAAIREAYEEVGVRINAQDLRHVHTLHSKTEGRTWLGQFFQTTTWEGTPELRELEKHTDLQWCDVNELAPETVPYVRQALRCITAGQAYSEHGWD